MDPYDAIREQLKRAQTRGLEAVTNRLDFVIESRLILEVKTTDIKLEKYHHQILSYMNQLQIAVGLLANFRQPRLQIKRLILPDKYLFKSV